jgi:hypothetical protein
MLDAFGNSRLWRGSCSPEALGDRSAVTRPHFWGFEHCAIYLRLVLSVLLIKKDGGSGPTMS